MYYPWEQAASVANVFDQVGFMYNLSAAFSLRTSGFNCKTILPVAATCLKNRYEEAEFDYRSFIDDFPWDQLTSLKNDRENNFENVIANLQVSSYTKSFISQIVDIVNDFELQWDSYESIKGSVEALESVIITSYQSETIPEEEYDKLMCMTSIARYASLYYQEYIPNPDESSMAARGIGGLFWKILGAIAGAALAIFAIGPAIVGGSLSVGGYIIFGLVGFGSGWWITEWGLNGFPLD